MKITVLMGVFILTIGTFPTASFSADDANDYALMITYYDGLSTLMREESVYKKDQSGKPTGFPIMQKIYINETNELREFSYFTEEDGKRVGHNIGTGNHPEKTPKKIQAKAHELDGMFSGAGPSADQLRTCSTKVAGLEHQLTQLMTKVTDAKTRAQIESVLAVVRELERSTATTGK